MIQKPGNEADELITKKVAATEVMAKVKQVKLLAIGNTIGGLATYSLSLTHKYAGLIAATGVIVFNSVFLYFAARHEQYLYGKYKLPHSSLFKKPAPTN